MNSTPTSGKDLRLMRVAADVRLMDLAARMGIKPSGVNAIEVRRIVTDKARDRYVTALATFATSETPAETEGAA
jgi:hypothetical protein